MKELLSTNDVVLLSFVEDVLRQEGIEFVLFDTHMSVVEGSIGILPRRVMVPDEAYDEASLLIDEAQKQAYANHQNNEDVFEDGSEHFANGELTDDLFLGGALKIFQPKKIFEPKKTGLKSFAIEASKKVQHAPVFYS